MRAACRRLAALVHREDESLLDAAGLLEVSAWFEKLKEHWAAFVGASNQILFRLPSEYSTPPRHLLGSDPESARIEGIEKWNVVRREFYNAGSTNRTKRGGLRLVPLLSSGG